MRRHVSVAAVDLRIVEAGLDHRALGVVRHQQRRRAVDRLEGADMAVDPIGEPLRPGRLRVGEARSAEHRDEDLRGAPLAGEPVDHHGHAVACIVNEQLVAGRVRLAHCHRQTAFPATVELAEARIAIPAGLARDVLLPQDRQRHVLALELAMHRRPVRLGEAPLALPAAAAGLCKKPGFQHRVGDVIGQRPAQPRCLEPADRQPHRRRGRPTRRAISRVGIPADFNLITSRTWRIASLSVGIQVPLRKAERRNRIGARRGLVTPGRHHPGMVGEIISERRARSNRNGGRDHSGIVGDIERNQQVEPQARCGGARLMGFGV